MDKLLRVKELKKRTKILGAIAVVLIVLMAIIFVKEATGFEDPAMYGTMKERGYSKANKRDLKYMKNFYTGTLSDYFTLADLKACRNLKKLGINVEVDNYLKELLAGEFALTNEENTRFNKEVAEIVSNNEELSIFIASNEQGNLGEWNWDFLSEGKNIHVLCFKNIEFTDFSFISSVNNLKTLVIMKGCKGVDYSQLEKCKNLNKLELEQMDIQTADQLAELSEFSGIETLWLIDCPICENETEMEKLRRKLPNTKIERSGYEINDILLEVENFDKYEE